MFFENTVYFVYFNNANELTMQSCMWW